MSSVLAYSTTTGEQPDITEGFDVTDLFDEPTGAEVFCFVCNRCTDHFGEHDDKVESGEAFYAPDGTVYTADLWHAWANPALRVA